MRLWVWRMLLAAMAVLALTGTALAADLTSPVVVDGFELTLNASKTGWTVTGFDGKEEEVVIPSLYKNKPVTAIEDSAFVVDPADPHPEKQLTKITIPGTVKTVGEEAFMGCDSLNTVTFQDYINAKGDVERNATIGESAFKNCTALENLTLSSNTLRIGANAFTGCSRLPSVVIPKFVDEISTGAFKDCSNLKEITFLDVATRFTGAFDSLTGMRRIHCPGNSTVYNTIRAELGKTKTERIVHTISDVKTEAATRASCTSAGIVQVSFACPPVVKEVPGTDADGNPTTTTVTTPCDTYPNGKYEESRTTSILPHTEGMPSSKESTCVEHGYVDKIDCTVCGTELSSTELPLIAHNYDEDAGVEEESLFPGRCDGTKGLSMVTKKCSVCGYTPVCRECQELIWKLEEAGAELEEAQEALAEAAAKLEAAAAAKERAEAAKTAAGEALTAAQKAKTEAAEAYAAAQGKTAEAQAALDAAVTDAEKEAAQKALDAAKAKEEEAKRASQAADRAVLESEIAQEEAQAALTEAEAACTAAETEKTDAENAVNNNTNVSTARENLRTHLADANKAGHEECAECLKLLEDIRAAKSESAKRKAEEAYAEHQADVTHKPEPIPEGGISGKESDEAPEHDWGEPEVPEDIQRPVCGSGVSIKVVPTYTCKVCGETKNGKAEILDAASEHKLPAKPEIAFSKPATCTEDGKTVYKDYTCETCNTLVTGEERVTPASGHKWADKPELDEIIRQPSCVDGGLKNTYRVCENENCPLKGAPQLKESNVPVEPNPLGHDWGSFVLDEGQDMTPNETCVEKQVTGTVSCSRNCGVEPERRTLTIEGLGAHNYKGSEWVTVKEATATEDGLKQRPCMNEGCTHMDEEVIPATGTPGEPEDPGEPDDPDTPTEPEKPAAYRVDVVQASNGTTSVNRTTAQSGDRVTITISPASDYELDMLRVISADGKVLNPDSLGSGQYRFTMPAANVEVRATFSRKSSSSWSGSNWASAPGEGSSTDPRRTTDVMPTQNPSQSVPKAGASEQVFRDIPIGHWAAGEINWANQMGYMNGTAGRFNPDGNITHQQMWMVLARLTGSHPANMTEARRWAVEHSFADGSSPTAAVSRHQLVTALYRCAHLMGSTNRNSTSLAGYTDSSTVPAVARDAFSWAVANGIVSGTANSRLDPNGTLTRAQFAVILYRYSQRI